MQDKNFSHVKSNLPSMVDISKKTSTSRMACAQSEVYLPDEVFSLLENNEIHLKKGPVLSTAIVAGTMAVKKTAELIPFCHQLPISSVNISIEKLKKNFLTIICEVKTFAQSGVEMECLTGASIAALTIYDMCKSVSPNIEISCTKLLEKRGGKSDFRAM